MKKSVLSIILLITSINLYAQEKFSELLEVANESTDNCLEFYDVMTLRRLESPTAEGYFALSTMMLAKVHKNPFTKLSYFNKGKKILESTIKSYPDNVELRFLRYAVQAKVPAILLYFNDMEDDKEILDGYLNNNSGSLAKRINRFYNMNKT
jgi:hypothetical protein